MILSSTEIISIAAITLFILSACITTLCGAALMIKLTLLYIGVGI